MVKIMIGGRHTIELDDSFLDVPKEEQNRVIERIGKSLDEKEKDKTSVLGATARHGLQTGLFGFSDEARGALRAAPSAISNAYRQVTGGKPDWEETSRQYKSARDAERRYLDTSEEEHPYASSAGTAAGILSSLAIPGGTIARGATPLRVAGIGAGYGAVDALGNSRAEDIPETVSDVATGAALGGTLGSAAHYGLQKLGRPVANWVKAKTPGSATNRAIEALKAEGLTEGGIKRLRGDLAGVKNLDEALARQGEGALVLDVSPTLKNRAEEVAVSGVPEARDILERSLASRQERAPERIYQNVNKALGNPRAGRAKGTLVFNRNITPQNLFHRMKKIGPEERAALKARVRQELQLRAGESTKDVETLLNDLKKPNVRGKIQAVIGERETDSLVNSLRQEENFKKTQRQILGGSQTAYRLSRQGDDLANPQNWPKTLAGIPSAAIRKIVLGVGSEPYRRRQIGLAEVLSRGAGERTSNLSNKFQKLEKILGTPKPDLAKLYGLLLGGRSGGNIVGE